MQIGNREVDVEQLRSDWALALMGQGVIVRLAMSRWRAKSKLTTEELGLRFSDEESAEFMRKYVTLGKYLLLPPKLISELTQIENRARQTLRDHSFYTVWGYFVPFNAFEAWEQCNLEVRNEYMEAARQLSARHTQIVADVKKDYRNLARDVWARLYPHSADKPTESFIEEFVSRIVEQVPSATDIISSFRYNTTFFVIPMPSFVEENLSRAQDIQRKRAEADAKVELEHQTRQRIADEYVNRKKELIDGFLEATVMSLRKYVSELCDSVLQSMAKRSKNGSITTKEKKRIHEMLHKVELLNFYDDHEVTELMRDLEREMDKFKGEVDAGEVTTRLRAIVDIGTKEFTPIDFNPSISSLEV